MSRPWLLALAAVLAASAADHYVSPSGDDSAPGTRAKPWRTLRKVSESRFQPGDRILLASGATFPGPLTLTAEDSGTSARKLLVTSDGNTPAVIDGAKDRAISVDGANYVEIHNLKLRGAGRNSGNSASGLVLARSTGSAIHHLEVAGFRKSGVEIDGSDDARIEYVKARDNGFAGISSGGGISKNLYIANCLAENNPGDPTVKKGHSGNGIVVAQAAGALVERCEARYNGWDMVWTGNGPVGIWAWESDRVTIQYCISHHNRSTASDGGGFDFDGGMTNSVLQYNYSHNNFGSGYLICQYPDARRFANNTVRYNISQDDGLKDHDAGIFVWVGGKLMESALVHNNTIFNSRGSAVAIVFDSRLSAETPQFDFYNNIFVSLSAQVRGAARARFAGNLYWAMGGRPFRVDGFDSLPQWAEATGQEKLAGRMVGRFADPMLFKDGPALLTDPAALADLHEYRLRAGSPADCAGLNLAKEWKLDPGSRDFYGTRLPLPHGWSLGAHEACSH